MTDAEPVRVREIATRVRSALEAGVLADHVGLRQFPRGACGDTCYLLGQYLVDQGFPPFSYICGYRHGLSHAWLQQDGWVVDITSDQFDDGPGPVIVANVSPWQDTFTERDPPHDCYLDSCDEFMAVYRKFVPVLHARTSGR